MKSLIALLLFTPFAFAEPELKNLRLGKVVLGPELKAEDLTGKVVLIEQWGLQCGPCIAAMPHLVSLHEELSDFGLVIVGLHRQEAKAGELKDRCTAMGIRFTIFDHGHIEGSDIEGIPHCTLFDKSGSVKFDGRPTEVDAKLRQAVGALLVSDIEKPTKAMQPVIDALKKGGSPLDALKKLTNLKNSGEKATSEQAKALSDRILEGGRARLETVKGTMKEDPVAAYESATQMALRWKGFETGTKAAEVATKLKADKNVTAELKARPTLDGIKKLDSVVSAVAIGVDFQSPEFKKKFGPQVKELQKAYNKMKTQYPEARATKEAFEIVEKYELPAGDKK